MSFFKKIVIFISCLGFVLFLFTAVFVGFILCSPVSSNTPKERIMEPYLSEEIQEFYCREDERTLYIDVFFYENHPKTYYLAYTYYYFDTYQKEIHSTIKDQTSSYLIYIDDDGISSFVENNM